MNWDRNDIQGLRARKPKIAIDSVPLESKEHGPISPGEVQVKELEFERASRGGNSGSTPSRSSRATDQGIGVANRAGKTRAAEAENQANESIKSYARVIDARAVASESLSTQLERATREHNLNLERLRRVVVRRQTGRTFAADAGPGSQARCTSRRNQHP